MSGGAETKHIGQDPKYLEKFIGDDDDLEDFNVEPDVFYGVCPPAPILSRISQSVFAHTHSSFMPRASSWPCVCTAVWGPSDARGVGGVLLNAVLTDSEW